MAAMFTIDKRDLKKLQKFFRDSPRLVQPVVANVLNSLAFKTREYDIRNINSRMIVRKPRFVERSIQVERARNTRLENQIAVVGTVRRKGFSGWEEQQKGTPTKLRRRITTSARGGNRRNVVRNKARLRRSNQFYKPDQFRGRSRQQSFYFMMRVLGSRGGGEFMLNQRIPTKRGSLGKGLYQLKRGRLTKLQNFERITQPRRVQFRTISLSMLRSRNDIQKIWQRSIRQILSRYR